MNVNGGMHMFAPLFDGYSYEQYWSHDAVLMALPGGRWEVLRDADAVRDAGHDPTPETRAAPGIARGRAGMAESHQSMSEQGGMPGLAGRRAPDPICHFLPHLRTKRKRTSPRPTSANPE